MRVPEEAVKGDPSSGARESGAWRPSVWLLLVVAGVAMIIGAATYGMVSIGSIGTGTLVTVPLGERITFNPSGAYRANIFTTRLPESDIAPRCSVVTRQGRRVSLGEPIPYAVNTRYDMESSYGFHLRADEVYLITCGSKDQHGGFAVVEVSQFPQVLSISLGIAGAALAAVGAIAMVVKRRRRRSPHIQT